MGNQDLQNVGELFKVQGEKKDVKENAVEVHVLELVKPVTRGLSEKDSNEIMESVGTKDMKNEELEVKTSPYPEEVILDEKGRTFLPIKLIKPFPGHVFNRYTGDRWDALVKSVANNGIISAVHVWKHNGEWFSIAGHNRTLAAIENNHEIIRIDILENLTYEKAAFLVTETNLIQRSFMDLTISERIVVIYNRYTYSDVDDISEIRDRVLQLENDTDAECDGEGENSRKRDLVSKTYDLSTATIARYVKLHNLIMELRIKLDDETIPFFAGIELSHINKELQTIVAEAIGGNSISIKKAKELRALAIRGKLDLQTALYCLNSKPNKNKPMKGGVQVKQKLIDKYFEKGTPSDQILNIIEEALNSYFEKNEKIEEVG